MPVFQNLNLFSIFKEAEIACMDEDFIDALGPLLDDSLSMKMMQFLENMEAIGIMKYRDQPIYRDIANTIDLIEEKLGTDIRRNTFHLQVREKDLGRRALNVSLAAIPTTPIDERDELLADVQWFLGNKQYWLDQFPERTKEAYQDFIYEVGLLQSRAQSMYIMYKSASDVQNEKRAAEGLPPFNAIELEYHDDLVRAVEANKSLFYLREKPRTTGTSYINRRQADLEKLEHCLVYNRMCEEARITLTMRYLIGGIR